MCVYIYMLFITLGDGPIDPSPRAKVQPIKHRPTPRDRSRAPYVTSHTPPYVPPIKHRPMRDQSCPHAPDTYCYARAMGNSRAGDVAASMM
jgi:hypothetical protein